MTEFLKAGPEISIDQEDVGEYVFYATQTIKGLVSEPALARMVISPPEGSISGLMELCINSPNTEYTTNLIAANSYEWTLNPSEAGIITAKGQNATINWNDSFAGDVEIQVKGIYDDEIELDADPLSVKIHQKPSSEILGVDKVCIEQLGELYRVDGAENHTYDWTVNGGTIKTGQETNQITIDWGASAGDATVSLTESVNGLDGCSSQASKYVIIRPDLAPEDPPDIHLKGGFILICADSGLYSYQWYHNNELVQQGEKQFYVTTEDERNGAWRIGMSLENGCTSNTEPFFPFEDENTSVYQASVSLFPNPADDFLTLEMILDETGKVQIDVMNNQGTIIKSLKTIKKDVFLNYHIQTGDLLPGSYFIRMKLNERKYFGQFVKE